MGILDLSTVALPLTMLAFFVAAMFYASVGHGGASAYLMVMALMGMPWMQAKPIALILNVCVSLLASGLWIRQGWFRWALFWPAALGSVPTCYLASLMPLNHVVFHVGLSLVLCFGAVRLLMPVKALDDAAGARSQWGLFLMGAGIGFLSGLLGIGGGVFLTPLIVLLGYAHERVAAAVSAVFILLNSLIGLMGWWQRGGEWPSSVAWLIPAVLLGGWLGGRWGSERASSPALRRCLSTMLFVAAVKFVIMK